MGVRIPVVAVACATAGLPSERQSPKGQMLISGKWSMIVAAPPGPLRFLGRITTSDDGLSPALQMREAPEQTAIPIIELSFALHSKEHTMNLGKRAGSFYYMHKL